LTAIVGLLGIFTAAAAETAYGKVLWNPIDIIDHWMDSGSHGGRAAAAFAAIGLIIVTLGINISANSISAANDLMAFCPKYINIRRGQVLAAFIGSWAFVPVCSSSLTFDQVIVELPANRRHSGKFSLQRRSSSHSLVVTQSSSVP
jgi:cytosine/uracil/thiamine/allantoin permease